MFGGCFGWCLGVFFGVFVGVFVLFWMDLGDKKRIKINKEKHSNKIYFIVYFVFFVRSFWLVLIRHDRVFLLIGFWPAVPSKSGKFQGR